MPIANFEQAAGSANRDVECGPRDQFLVVQVTGVRTRRSAADATRGGERCQTHAPEKWLYGDLDSRREARNTAIKVEGDDAGAGLGILIGQEAAARRVAVIGIRDFRRDFEDANFERISRRCALAVDRPDDNLISRAFVFDRIVGAAKLRLNLVRLHTGGRQTIGTTSEE